MDSRSSVRTATSRSTRRPCRARAASAASNARTAGSSSRSPASPSRRCRATPLADGVFQRLRFRQVLELLQRVVLDLPDPFARDAEGTADLLERLRRPAVQPEAERDDVAFAL